MLFGAAAWRLDLGSKDVSVKARELLLNESGNRRTRTIRLRNRLTLAKQGPVTWPLSWSTRASEDRRCTALCAARRARRARASPPGEAEETRSVCRTLSEVPDVVRRDAKRLSDVVRLKNGIKSWGFDIHQTNMDASDVIAPVDPPRTRSALAAIHQQAMKGLRAPSTPLEVKLNDELSASAIKTKQARDKLELRGAIVQDWSQFRKGT